MIIIWMIPLSFLGVLGVIFNFKIFFYENLLAKRIAPDGSRVLRRHIWGYAVCLCPTKGTPGLNELMNLNYVSCIIRKPSVFICKIIDAAHLISLLRRSSSSSLQLKLSRLIGKPTICIGENKDADHLRGNREADQRLCFRYTDSTIPLLSKSKISSL